MSLNDTLQQIVNMSEEDKVGLAASAYTDLMPVLRQIDTKNNGNTLLFAILGSVAAADGKLTTSEAALIRAILSAEGLDLSSEQIFELVQASANENVHDLVVKLAGAMNAEQCASLFTLMAALSSIDDTISREEVAYLLSLLE